MDRPTVSLCMIVKNEAEFIDDCLRSAMPAVDECIVCDTGSTDRTVDLARAAGATVVSHEWTNDFSAARNAALAHASCDFVLLLDADERLHPGSATRLTTALAKNDFDLGLLTLHNADGLDASLTDVVLGHRRHHEPQLIPRLFRRTADLRWEGPIHESPNSWMATPNRAVQTVPVHIVHYGTVPELRAARGKAERNLTLLEAHCAEHPGAPTHLTYLARERLRADNAEGALEAASRAWSLYRDRLQCRQKPAPFAANTITIYGFLLLTQGDGATALAVLAEASALGIDHPNIALLRATALLEHPDSVERATMEQAARELEAALARRGEVFAAELLPGAAGSAAARMLAKIVEHLGDPQLALVHLENAHRMDPSDVHIQLELAEAHLRAGRPLQAFQLVEPHLSHGLPDAWLIAARTAMDSGQHAQVPVLLHRAEHAPGPWKDPKRRPQLAHLRATVAARELLSRLMGGRLPPTTHDPAALLEQAREALEQGALGRAMQILPRVLATRPADVDAWCLLGHLLLRQGVAPIAREIAQIARRLQPEAPAVSQLAGRLDPAGGT